MPFFVHGTENTSGDYAIMAHIEDTDINLNKLLTNDKHPTQG